MGGFNGFEDLNPSKVVSIKEFVQTFWQDKGRPPVIALDMAHHIMQSCNEGKTKNEGIGHQTLFKRLASYCKLGANLVCVFDGPLEECKKRHDNRAQASAARQFGPVVIYAKKLCQNLGLCMIEAPSEAEALCAYLQKHHHVDVVFSGDADILANGAQHIMRFTPHHYLNTNTPKSSLADERLVQVYELDQAKAPQFALMSLILGNDWAEGLEKIGKTTANAICKPETRFASRLAEIADLDSEIEQNEQRLQWRDDFIHELRTNEHKWLARKSNQEIPFEFPDLEMFDRMLCKRLTYDSKIFNVCEQCKRGMQPDLLNKNFEELKAMWKQNFPGFRKANKVNDEKLEKGFKSVMAPLMVASALLRNHPVLPNFQFKEINNKHDVELIRSHEDMTFHANKEFLAHTRVPRFVFDASNNAKPPMATKRESAVDRASKNNSKITKFFVAGSSKAKPTISPLGSVEPVSIIPPQSASHTASHQSSSSYLKSPQSVSNSPKRRSPETDTEDDADMDSPLKKHQKASSKDTSNTLIKNYESVNVLELDCTSPEPTLAFKSDLPHKPTTTNHVEEINLLDSSDESINDINVDEDVVIISD